MVPTAATTGRLLALIAGPRRMTAAVTLAFAVTAVGLLAVPPRALAWDTGAFSSTSESMLISLQNQARASAGLKSLKLDTALRKIARWRSQDMVERNYFSHTIKGTDRKVFWYMQNKYDYCFKLAGENIGTVTWEGATVEEATNWVFNAFMDSSGHRANIMGKAWDVVAVGAYKGPGSQFMWTVLFADRCGSTAPKATPKPTPKATPKPKATPRATPRATPKPTPKAASRATPRPKPTAHARAGMDAVRPRADGGPHRGARRAAHATTDRAAPTPGRGARPGCAAGRGPAAGPRVRGHDPPRRHGPLLRVLTHGRVPSRAGTIGPVTSPDRTATVRTLPANDVVPEPFVPR